MEGSPSWWIKPGRRALQKLENTPEDPHTECQGILINGITLLSIYIPPSSSCKSGYKPILTPYLQYEDSILAGDFNAHDPLWHSELQDARGSDFADEIGNSNLGTLNDESPTRLPSNGQSSSPDISMASLSLLPYASWETKTSLGSDHLPIVITLQTDIKPITSENRTFINFRKADWEKFEEETEIEFEKLSPAPDIHKGENTFRKIINKISKTSIPAGRIKQIFPEMSTEAISKMKERSTDLTIK